MSNTITTKPTLDVLFKLFKKEIFTGFNCHGVGRIETFDVENQTAEISVAYSKSSVNDDTEIKQYPVLIDCPIIVLGGGVSSLRFPIKKDDECLIFFNDRDIDNWFDGGAGAVLNSDRKHSFSDAIAIVGLRSTGNVLPDYDPDKTELIHDDLRISLGDKISINNAVENLYDILDRLAGVLENFLSTPAAVGSPVSLSLTQVTEMQGIRTDLDKLME